MLVIGAAGGVGLTAIEIGKASLRAVLAAASTPEKLELAKRHGADAVFNYTRDTIKAKVMEFTGDRGIDVAYDPVGADFAEQVVRSMAWNGRYLVIGFAGGKIPAIPPESGVAQGLLTWLASSGVLTLAKSPRFMLPGIGALRSVRERKMKPHVTEHRGFWSASLKRWMF